MKPKFRAWDKEEKRMWNVETLFIEDEWVRANDGSIYGEHKDIVRSFLLLQSTGLKDVHEVEFFDKDIARDIDSGELGVVEYINGSFVMKFVGGDGVDLYDVKDNFEIIGNKFEHPHLLRSDGE
ncbi:YopX family protein [Staphylococcus xylosus]|uniref:YopX family protein n=1 Tax=Staphylococcus xylosus TaxID=1288 RepID=UPI0033651CB5